MQPCGSFLEQLVYIRGVMQLCSSGSTQRWTTHHPRTSTKTQTQNHPTPPSPLHYHPPPHSRYTLNTQMSPHLTYTFVCKKWRPSRLKNGAPTTLSSRKWPRPVAHFKAESTSWRKSVSLAKLRGRCTVTDDVQSRSIYPGSHRPPLLLPCMHGLCLLYPTLELCPLVMRTETACPYRVLGAQCSPPTQSSNSGEKNLTLEITSFMTIVRCC